MFSSNDKISLRQLQALLILDIFGTSIITLPRITTELAGQNGWMLLIGATILIFFYVLLLNKLSSVFPDYTFVELSQKLATKPIGILLCIGLGLKLLFTTGLQLRIFCEIIKQTMLIHTPIWVTGGAMLLTASFLAYKGYEARGRAAEILLVVMFLPLIFVFILACFHTDFSNLLPVYPIPIGTFLKGSFFTAFSFQGVEFLLLIYPFLRHPEKAGKASGQAIIVIGLLMLFTTLITVARFGPEEVKVKLWPVLQMMDTIDIPGSFIERQDIIIMRFWIISTFASVNAGIFLLSLLGNRLIKKQQLYSRFLFFIVPVLFILSLLPRNVAHAYRLLDWVNRYLGTIFFIIVPILLFLLYLLHAKGGEQIEHH